MKTTNLDCVFIYTALLHFFLSTSFRSVHKSLSEPFLATVPRLIFLGVDVLHVCLCSIRATMRGGVVILNAFGSGEQHQQPRVFSRPSLLVRTLLFPMICGLFLMSFMVQDLAFPQQLAGRFGALSAFPVTSHILDSRYPESYYCGSAARFFRKHAGSPMISIAVGTVGRCLKRVFRNELARVRAVIAGSIMGWDS
jgi:hypothetical protein